MRVLWLILALLIATTAPVWAAPNAPAAGVVTPADTTPDFPGSPISGIATPDDTTPDFPGVPVSGVVVNLDDDVAPSVVMTAPVTGYYQGIVPWNADIEDDDLGSGAATGELYLNDIAQGNPSTGPSYSGTAIDTTQQADGTATTVKIEGCDNAGNCQFSNTETVTADNTAPINVAITSPSAGPAGTVGDVIEIVSTAEDTTAGVSSVECFRDGVSIGGATPTVNANEYSCSWNTVGLSAASYDLTTVAVDAAGSDTASAAITVSLSDPAPSGDIESDLLVHLKLDDGSGTTATDSSGNGLHGALTNGNYPTPPSWVGTSPVLGDALAFDSSVDHVIDLGNSAAINSIQTGPLSLCLWLNAETLGDSDNGRLIVQDGPGTTFKLELEDQGDLTSLEFSVATSGSVVVRGNDALTLNTLQHWCVTWDGSLTAANVKYYLNGAEASGTYIGTSDGSGTISTATGTKVTIGNRDSGTHRSYDGLLDEIRIYTRELAAADVACIHTVETGGSCAPDPDIESGQVAFMKFDENSGTSTTADSSGVENDGALTDVNHASPPSWATGQVNSALDFEADTNHIVNLGTDPSINDLTSGPMSIVTWMNPESLGDNDLGRIVMQDGSATVWRLNLGTEGDGSSMEFVVIYDDTWLVRSTDEIDLATMQHIGVTWDGSLTAANVKIYRDGAEVSTYETTQDGVGNRVSDPSVDVTIGDRDSNVSRAFDGIIDELRLYNRALPADSIAFIHSEEQGGTGPPPPTGDAYYVSKSGSDGNACQVSDGTEDATKAKLTITAGMTCLSSGDTLIVKDGTYNETVIINVPSGTTSAYTTIRAQNIGNVRICPTSFNNTPKAQIMKVGPSGLHHVRVQGFELDSTCYPDDPDVGTTGLVTSPISGDPSHHLLFEYIEIHSTRGDGSFLTSTSGTVWRWMHIHDLLPTRGDQGSVQSGATGIYSQQSPPGSIPNIVEDSIIEDIPAEATGNGMVLTGSVGTIIRRNIIRNIGDEGPILLKSADGGNTPTTDTLVYNNIFYNSRKGIQLNDSEGFNNRFYHNTVYNVSLGTTSCIHRINTNRAVSAEQAALIKNNIFFNCPNDSFLPADNFNDPANPQFTNAAAGDFTLQAGSAAVDASSTVDLTSIVPDDFNGTSRPQGSDLDYGAYEQ